MDNIEDPQLRLFAYKIKDKLEDENLVLDIAEFVELGMTIFSETNIPIKNSMLCNASKKTVDSSSNYTFSPRINKNSKKIAMHLDRDITKPTKASLQMRSARQLKVKNPIFFDLLEGEGRRETSRSSLVI